MGPSVCEHLTVNDDIQGGLVCDNLKLKLVVEDEQHDDDAVVVVVVGSLIHGIEVATDISIFLFFFLDCMREKMEFKCYQNQNNLVKG